MGQGRQANDRGRRTARAGTQYRTHALRRRRRRCRRRQIRHDHLRRCAGQGLDRLHEEGQGQRQAVLPLAQHHADARVHLPRPEVQGDDESRDELRHGRSRDGAARRLGRCTVDGPGTPFRATKGTVYEGGFRVPAIIRWPGKVQPGKVENSIFSGLDWFPTFVAAAGNPNIVDELKAGKDLGGTTYKVHLDGYDQTDLLTGKGPSKRHKIWYFAESNLGGLRLDEFKYRFIDQPEGWPGPKVPINMPILENIKQDPFERLPVSNLLEGSPAYFNDFYAREFWRFVYVQQKVGELAQTAIEFPPMQKGASFNLAAVKEQVEAAIAKGRPGQ